MKKVLAAALLAALLLLPLGGTALAGHEEAGLPAAAQGLLSGDAPAQLAPADAMSPALHAMVLAMLHHDKASFDGSDAGLAWETLYNMLSLYGQLDSRSELQNGQLAFPVETAQDYAAALDLSLDELPPLPAALGDRLTYTASQRTYQAVCGSDDLAQLQVRDVQADGGLLTLTGALVYDVDGSDLAQFQAVLAPRDNMFGYAVTAFTLC